MNMIDLYAMHEEKAREGLLTIHPSRWLYAGRQVGRGGVFDLLSHGTQEIRVGDQLVKHFKQLQDVGLNSKTRHKHGYYFATAEIAERYLKYVPQDRGLECAVRDVLSVRNPAGQAEVHTPVGYVDLLLPTAVIEVKSFVKWKHALGQVLAYSSYYRDRRKIIHLYVPGPQRPKLIEQLKICAEFNVSITYQNLLSSRLGPMSRLGQEFDARIAANI
ncbi:hypothetical protein [Burkholderia stabilis]|uniref:hypothetical protein n=1 Tax=Burkholderia stabilis TaxID=95485 RepID=UPI0012EA7F41|nr:hypothetical protein [Burkholderia stabilis]HDR9493844.1 hypothetical protein [Burkholderia stabilis]HDR9527897.1 hypothetical protein [Burkholderia stabilis]HDR9534984.1 hypothetical protein [Burkholderia stabilis]HDR9541624.1 hypothetical protein [Burkholderia stabilis]HDR9548683.1 hypothetical protein [Burkholderia stabilis]